MVARRMSTRRRAAIFAAAGGVCHICGGRIDGTREAWEADHVIPLEIGGDDSDGNLAPAHVKCHRAKTAEADIPAIAKARRVAAKHDGTYHRPRRRSGLKKKLNGAVVDRKTGLPVGGRGRDG